MQRIGQIAFLSAGVLMFSCRGVEEQTLSKFFDAVRSGDHVTLLGMSVVGFSGPIESWDVVEIQSESRAPFRLPELRRQQEDVKEEKKRRFYEFMEFVNRNPKDFKMIRDRIDEDPDYRFEGAWGEIQAEFETYVVWDEDWRRRRDDILVEINRELKLSKMSLMSAEDFDRLDGEVVTREVLVRVTKPESGERPYLFTLLKYELTSTGSEYKPPSRWIIAAIEEELEDPRALESKN